MRQELNNCLEPYGQQHVLQFWDEISQEAQQTLADQIRRIDLQQIERLTSREEHHTDWAAISRRAQSPPAFCLDENRNRFTMNEAIECGETALREGKVAALMVAGGQGSRLGFYHPKGMFQIGPISNATLFQILIEKVIATGKRYDVEVPLCLMTSAATDVETRKHLQDKSYYGLAEKDLMIFKQGNMPAVDAEKGTLLLAEKGSLALSPDGHGGTLEAISSSGVLDQLADRGIEVISYFQVDNPICPVCDPLFIGYHLLSKSELSTQVIKKTSMKVKLGNVVLVDGKIQIIEYFNLPKDVREQPDALDRFWAGNVAAHIIDVSFLQKMAHQSDSLPFHLAKKVVPFVDCNGNLIEPDQPNAIKFEKFIFDLIPNAMNAIVVEVAAEEAFAPIKNSDECEKDSPKWVKKQMNQLYTRWLRDVGAVVDEGITMEISPLYALDQRQLAEKISPKTKVSSSQYFC